MATSAPSKRATKSKREPTRHNAGEATDDYTIRARAGNSLYDDSKYTERRKRDDSYKYEQKHGQKIGKVEEMRMHYRREEIVGGRKYAEVRDVYKEKRVTDAAKTGYVKEKSRAMTGRCGEVCEESYCKTGGGMRGGSKAGGVKIGDCKLCDESYCATAGSSVMAGRKVCDCDTLLGSGKLREEKKKQETGYERAMRKHYEFVKGIGRMEKKYHK